LFHGCVPWGHRVGVRKGETCFFFWSHPKDMLLDHMHARASSILESKSCLRKGTVRAAPFQLYLDKKGCRTR
jgi:hypothetical protein